MPIYGSYYSAVGGTVMPPTCAACRYGNHVSCHGLTICQCDTCAQIRMDAEQDQEKDKEEERWID